MDYWLAIAIDKIHWTAVVYTMGRHLVMLPTVVVGSYIMARQLQCF